MWMVNLCIVLVVLPAAIHGDSHTGADPPPRPDGGPGGPGGPAMPGRPEPPPGPAPTGPMPDDSKMDDMDDDMDEDKSLLEMFTSYLEMAKSSDAMDALMKAKELMDHKDMDFGDLTRDQRMDVITEYMKAHVDPPDQGQMAMDMENAMMLKNYLGQYKEMKMKQNSGVRQSLEAAAEALMDNEMIDNVKVLYMAALESVMSLPRSPVRPIITAVANQLRLDPKNMMLQQMLLKAVEDTDDVADKMMVMTLFSYFLHTMDPEDDLAKLSMNVLHKMVEMPCKDTPRIAPTMMLQHYLLARQTDAENMAFGLMNSLLNLMDDDSYETAGKLAYFITSMANKPMQIPDNDIWKWDPPTMCRLMNDRGETINRTNCDQNRPCVGPATIQLSGTNYMVSICVHRRFLLYHACRVEQPDGTLISTRTCDDSECSLGPFSMPTETGEISVWYCMSVLSRQPSDFTMYDRACSLVDDQNTVAEDSQRRCPNGYSCDSGPVATMNTRMDGFSNMMMCRQMADKRFISEIMDKALGPLPMFENDEERDKMFMDFVMSHIMDAHSRLQENMDPDAVGLMILADMIDEMEETMGTRGLAGEVYEIMKRKKEGMYGLNDMDKQVMQKMIMYFVNKHQMMMGGPVPPRPDGPQGPGGPGGPGGPDSSSQDLLMQLLRMYVQQPPPPPRPANDMASLLNSLLGHMTDHQELAETQAKHKEMIDNMMAHMESQGYKPSYGSGSNEDMVEKLMKMMANDQDKND